ncbi:CvpA family protein [Sphingomonas sp. SUN039]|uniref:CvpA family protein n=1 Tax=Sphingomonas sp. SUN039 TaxID=2937787 RepID=UPI00216490D8|nr:CvpA family protein [Sphingomonas sp. SUN039]UVO53446.1 CvpA family protein [Sphingomonas sp. SUN039]
MTGAGFTSLDMMVLVSLSVAGGFGAMRGFVGEVFSLAAWIAGIVAVKLLHGMAMPMLVKPVGSEGGASILAVALVFGLAFLAVKLLGSRLGHSARSSLLGLFDRVLGLGFGMVKGLLAATLAFLLMGQVYDILNGRNAARPDWMVKSRTYDLLRASSAALIGAVEAGRAR